MTLVNKIILTSLTRSGSYIGIGALRFYRKGSSTPITITTSALTNVTTTSFTTNVAGLTGTITTSISSYNASYAIGRLIDTSQNGTVYGQYWLNTNSTSPTITITFNTLVNIDRISYIPYPDAANVNRGILSFNLAMYNSGTTLFSKAITPNSTARNAVNMITVEVLKIDVTVNGQAGGTININRTDMNLSIQTNPTSYTEEYYVTMEDEGTGRLLATYGPYSGTQTVLVKINGNIINNGQTREVVFKTVPEDLTTELGYAVTTLALNNTQPSIDLTASMQKINVTVLDEDDFSYSVYLNDHEVMKLYDVHGYDSRIIPVNGALVNTEGANIVRVDVADRYGYHATKTASFFTELIGIHLYDEDGNLLSDMYGTELLSHTLPPSVAGSVVAPRRINVTNRTGFPLKDVEVWVKDETTPVDATVFIDFDENGPFDTKTLKYGEVLEKEGTLPVYIKYRSGDRAVGLGSARLFVTGVEDK